MHAHRVDLPPDVPDISSPETRASRTILLSVVPRLKLADLTPCEVCRQKFVQADLDADDGPVLYKQSATSDRYLIAHKTCLAAALVTTRAPLASLEDYIEKFLDGAIGDRDFTTQDEAITCCLLCVTERYARALSRHERIAVELGVVTAWTRRRLAGDPRFPAPAGALQ